MVFSSIVFIFIFLPVVLGLYFIASKWVPFLKHVILLLGSIFFYAWGEPVYVFLMIFSVVFNYFMGIDISNAKETDGRNPKLNLIFAVVINIFILGFFKYYGFLVETVNSIFGSHIQYTELALPIGISFYTFQALSYIIDVYWNRIDVQKNFLSFAVYITMFPQLIAGPIVKYHDIEKQLGHENISIARFGEGAERFVFGLVKKVLLANNFGLIYDQVTALGGSQTTMLSAWFGIIAYGLQIYFDFSGYSDMAIGLGKMLGFDFMENFNYPYISKSINEFWHRWHISLTTWFREYIYIPLGGNRTSSVKHIRNIVIVWLLTGLWHGASWNFVFWGMYFCVFLLLEKYAIGNLLKKLPPIVGSLYTLFVVTVGWVFFSITDMGSAFSYLGDLFGGAAGGFANATTWYLIRSFGIIVLIGILACRPGPFRRYTSFAKKHPTASILVTLILFILCVACLVYDTYNPFLYFRF